MMSKRRKRHEQPRRENAANTARGRRFVLRLVAPAMLLLGGCGEQERDTGNSTLGGADSTSSTNAGGSGGTGGGITVATCQGQEVPKNDLPMSPDGTGVDVPCAGRILSVRSIATGVFRLTFDPAESVRPSFATIALPPLETLPLVGGSDETAIVCTEELRVAVDRKSCQVSATDKSGKVILESAQDAAAPVEQGGQTTVRFRASRDERYYGFGEKTGDLDKRGRTLSFYNTDAYDSAFGGYPPDADPLYASVPFFVGLREGVAFGYFLDNTHRLAFDMAASDPSAWSATTTGGVVDQYLFAGPNISTVVERYTQLTGRLPLPPAWSLGYHQSRWGYSPDTKVLDIANELRNRKIPADAMWLDIQHMDGFRSFTWDPLTFPNPEDLSSDLLQNGFRTVAIVDPGIKVDPAWDVYSDTEAKGYFLKQPDGQTFVGEVWPGASVFPDFSNPDVRANWGSLVPRTTSKGVSGLWIDMNEPSNFTGMKGGTVPDDLVCHGDGFPTTMAEIHNVYALLEAEATYEGMKSVAPDERPFVLTRAGYSGTQRFAAMWTGDAPSSWATLQTTLPMLLGMGLSGLTFSGSDVGGYSGFATPELYGRWMQVGSFSPFFRNHVATGTNDQEPWQFGTEITDISRAVIEERYRLMPYLYSLFREAATSGAPVLRPVVYEFQGDAKTHNLGDQAMLGPFVLFAPVLTEGATTRSVYLPAGRWFEANSGAIVEGPAVTEVGVVLGALPTFIREGAIVPRRDLVQSVDEKPISVLTLDVYPGEKPSKFTLYEDDGHSFAFESGAYRKTTYSLARSDKGATLTADMAEGSFAPPKRTLEVRIRRVDAPPTSVVLSGTKLPLAPSAAALSGLEKGYFYDERDLSILVRLTDPAKFDLVLEYDPTVTNPAPDVVMDVEVTVPAGTPSNAPIHFASSANGWTHEPLAWIGPNKAGGPVTVPRGKYFFYKYTRGGWDTVEKWPGCEEATNRYELGKAHPTKVDTVWEWADLCP